MKRSLLALTLISVVVAASCDVNPAERNNAGNALYETGDYSLAAQAYQAAMVADPDRPEPYYNVASALARSGRQQAAVEALEQALRTADPLLTQAAYYNLGVVFFEMARYEQAVAVFREALQLDPFDADARFNYELSLLRLNSMTSTPPDTAWTSPTPTGVPDIGAGTPTPTQQASGETEDPTPPVDSAQQDEVTPTVQPDSSTPPLSEAASELVLTAAARDGVLSPEEAERSLDAVQQSQRTLREILQHRNTPLPAAAKDW